MNEADRHLMTVFSAALEHESAEERDAYLDEACRNDSALRARVDALLRAHERAAGFLEPPASPGAGTNTEAPVVERPGEPAMADASWRGAAEPPGTVIGPYKLIEPIGEGGMGVVWMAQQTDPVRRVVAVKLIKAGMDSRQVIARFEAERQALALMDHAHIARVLDAGTTPNGRPYFVMDLVKGVPITRYCDEHHLTPRQRLELFIPVCQAVQHAHQKGIIHRDLKPSNVLVAPYDGKPVPKVIDFGVAKAAGQQLTDKTLVTGFGHLVGTLEYMSPEQAEINQLDIDTRSDIYSLGVLLYELLAGSPPFSRKELEQAGMLEMLRVIREQEPTRPSTKLSGAEGLPTLAANRGTEPAKLTKLVRGELDWIVMKALEKDRDRRYETANGFAIDIQRYLADEPVQACPPSAGYRLRKFARRNKRILATAGVMALVLVLGTAISIWLAIRAIHAERLANANYQTAEEQRQAAKAQEALATEQRAIAVEQGRIAKAQELLARRRFRAAQTNLALQAWEAGQPARALELLESQRPKLDQEDLRGFDWYYLWRLCHRNLHRTLGGPKGEAVSTLAITPDGKTLVSGSPDASVRVWDVATGKERAVLTGHDSEIWRLAISPDGKMLASASWDRTVRLWDLDRSELLATLSTGAESRSVAFSPDGKVLAAGTEAGALELWDVGARRRRLTLPAHPGPTIALAYSPDGKLLATGAAWNISPGPVSVKVWDVTLQPPRKVFEAPPGGCAVFSPDGKLLAACEGGNVKVWRMPSGEPKASFESPDSSVTSVAFAADGNTLVLGCHDRTVKLWAFATGATRTVGVHLGPVNAVAFFPQGDLLASASGDGTVKLWHASPPRDSVGFARESAIRSLAFTPDSKLLVVGSDHPTALVDAATGKETTTLPVGGVGAASADANLLAAWAADDKLRIWDVGAARARAVLPVGPHLGGAAFSPDGKTIVTWAWVPAGLRAGTVRLWDLVTSRVRLALTGLNIHCAAFSPDGRTLATGHQFGAGAVRLWDPASGQKRMGLQEGVGFISTSAVAFSNDGKMLAAGTDDGTIRLWDVESGQARGSFQGHTDAIHSLAFSPDDKTLLSGSADRTARLWDAVTGQELLTLKGHRSPVTRVVFAPDGKRLATAGGSELKRWLAAADPEATAFRSELGADDPDGPRAMNNWGDRLRDVDRDQEAEDAHRKARARLEKLVAAFPDTADYRAELAYSLLAPSLVTDPPSTAAQSGRQFAEIWRTLPADWQFRLGQRFRNLGHALHHQKKLDKAIAAWHKAIELDPKLANAYNNLAWLLATCSDAKSRDPKRALTLARKAVELDPNNWGYLNTLGAAYYRAGDWKAAIAALNRSVEKVGENAFDGFFLAMAHWQLGEKDKAREWYDRAVQWVDKNAPTDEELRRFRAEASELFGVKEEK